MNLKDREPLAVRAAVVGVATAVIHLFVVYGLLDEEGASAAAAIIDSFGLLALVLLARPAVTANAKVIARVTTDGDVVAGDASPQPTGSALMLTKYSETTDGVTVVQEPAITLMRVKPDRVRAA